jgi:predicted DNA-binding ribbon-helix-helix protein
MSAAPIVKRSVAIAGHRTSVSLEQPFWDELQAIAKTRGVSAQALVAEIDNGRAGQAAPGRTSPRPSASSCSRR